MEPIFNKEGSVVGWIVPEGSIVDTDGNYRAFIRDGAVFDYRSHFLGRLHDGYFWDRDGYAVGSILGMSKWPKGLEAGKGPALAHKGVIPRPPPVAPEPEKPSTPLVSEPMLDYSNHWSDLNWNDFLGGKHKLIAYRS